MMPLISIVPDNGKWKVGNSIVRDLSAALRVKNLRNDKPPGDTGDRRATVHFPFYFPAESRSELEGKLWESKDEKGVRSCGI